MAKFEFIIVFGTVTVFAAAYGINRFMKGWAERVRRWKKEDERDDDL